MEHKCYECDKIYASYQSLWNHNKKKHNIEGEKQYFCQFCKKILSCRQSKWRHEKTCKTNSETNQLKDKIEQIEKQMEKIKAEPKIITNNTTNNTTNNIQYIINAPTASSTNHLTFEQQTDILDKGLNSLVYLIEMINFNKSVPENHSYCVTAINDKHASVIDEKTNKIIKTDKLDLFDKVLGANLDNLEKISNNPQFTNQKRIEYKSKINYLRNKIFQNSKFLKRYQNDINIISYNNKDMVKNTWKCLKEVDNTNVEYKVQGFDDLVKEEEEEGNKVKTTMKLIPDTYNDSDSELSDSELSEISENDDILSPVEIKIKNKTYIMEGNKLYYITNTNQKGQLCGFYIDGKIIKSTLKNKEIDV